MTRITYEQAYDDHYYLWKRYGSARDMTGGYVDQEDLDRMLKTPTKTMAKNCLCSQIDYWFQMGTDDDKFSVDKALDDDPHLMKIAERHGHR